MARRKGATKSKNANNRKHITDSSQPSKGNTRLKDDPGGTTGTSRNKSPHRRNMDGPKLISDARNTSNTMIDHYNLQNHHHQLSYGQSRDSSSLDANSTGGSFKKKGSSNRISESVGDAHETVTSATTTTTQRVATETPTNINNNNNSSSHNNNSSFSNTMTTTMTVSSAANDHKYLHKKFKRIASATSESNSAATANVPEDSSSQSDQHRSQQKHQQQLQNDSNSNISSSSSSSTKSNKVACRLEEISPAKSAKSGHSFKEHGLTPDTERTNSLVKTEESSGSSYIIVNGTGRLTPLFSAVDSVSIADTGYGSDGELKLSVPSNNGLYKTAESVIATQPQLLPANHHHNISNNVAHRMPTPIPATSRTSPCLVVQPPAPVTLNTLRPDITYNSAATKLPHPQQLAQMPSGHSPQHMQLQQIQLQRQPVRHEQPSPQLQQQPVTVDQNNSGRHSCPYCNLNCTKPSVLQKHIRTHTNERPYRCEKCCFAFKTKSNYYKHCRSRSHALRVRGIEPQPEDENSIGSDPDPDPDISNSSSDVISRTASPLDERTSSPAIQYQTASNPSAVQSAPGLNQQHQQNAKYSIDKPYKPKFHNASFYVKEELPAQKQQQQQQQIHLLQLQQQQQLYQQSQQRQQHLQYQQFQQQHQPQLNSYHNSPNSHSMNAQPKVEHPERETSPVYYQQQQLQQAQQLQLQSQQYHNQSSTKSRIEYLAQQRLQAAQSAAAQQASASVIASSSFTESPSSSSTSSSTVPTLGRSLSTGIGGHQLNVEEHISYLISRNEAIVNKELPLQKKYPKVAGKSKSLSTVMSNTTSRLAYTLNNKQQQQQQQQQSPSQQHLQGQLMPQQSNLLTIPGGSLQVGMPMQLQKITVQHQINPSQIAQMHQQQQPPPQQPVQLNEPTPSGSAQPLNLSKIGEQSDLSRKRVPSEGFASPVAASEAVASTSSGKAMPHPQNPERSIIKNLLLHARGEAIPNGEGEQTISTCVLCKMEFHSADDLKTHAVHYCQGGPSSAPISPVGSSGFKYSRSNSISVNLPEMNNPNSLAKLARSKLLLSQNPRSLAKLAWSQLKTKPSNLVLTQLSVNTSSTPQTSSSATGTSGPNMSQKLMTETPLPSPGPLLGKTPLVESYNNSERKSDDVIITKVHDEARQFVKTSSPKRLKFDGYPQSSSAGAAEVAGPSHGGRMYSSMCGGDMTPLEKKEEPMKRFFSSGGCMIPLSECPDLENSPKIIRTPLLSGGSFQEISPKPAVPQTPKSMISVKPLSSILTPGLPTSGLLNAASLTRFQFPPINSITAYNPLTLPPVSMTAVIPTSVSYGDKVIPFVPGIPGPNSLSSTHLTLQPPKVAERSELSRNVSPNRKKTPSPLMQSSMLYPPPKQPSIRVEDDFERSGDCLPMQRSPRSWVPPTEPPPKKSFNFTRIADNLSPRKTPTIERSTKSPERGVDPPRHFNFDKIEKARSENGSSNPPNNQMVPLHVDISSSSLREREQTTATAGLSSTSVGVGIESKFGAKSKFLRPTSLPLKPGTFTPKCHHGITPTANTLPLISPETPRPSKHCVQLYLNGHAYTYLGLKSSTKMFYCTVNCPQPSYIALNRLSMYSKWQTCEENNPHPLRLGPKAVMSLYDSRQRDPSYSSAPIKSTVKTTHSQPIVSTPFENNTGDYYYHQMKSVPELSSSKSCSGSVKSQKSTGSMPGGRLVGGYESNEDYTYVRGRGRGRYVCSECGIRCKKPSMLKKHIRTHTDVRPYTCQHCSFSFKTKGNLTKHMQSKTHYKKCLELGINLGPMPEGEYGDNEFDYDQQSINSGGGRTSSVPGESDSDEYSDGNEGETESSDTDESKSRLAEHEAARSLLSLSMTPPSNQAAISPNPFTQHHQPKLAYPYSRDHQQQSQQFPESVFQCVSDRCSTDEPLQMNRRVISFTSPKPPFDYQKQEQYFSNPSLSLKTPRNEDAAMKPMDLTKPRRMDGQPQPPLPASSSPSRISEVISESGLIKSLVSITNKIRPNMEHSFVEAAGKFNEDVQLQAYLTEQALKHTKMKQSQINKTFNMPALSVQSPSMSPTIPTITITDSSHSVQSPGRSSSTGILTSVTTTVTCAVVRSQCSPLPSLTATSLHSEDAPVECETVATCTASPTLANESIEHRMENGEVESPSDDGLPEAPSSSTLKLQPAPNSTTTSAKSVASEYLKMTSAESRNIRVDESDDSCSDQELSSSELAVKPSSTEFTGIVPPTVIVGEDGFKSTNEVQPMFRVHLSDDGRPVCKICSKTFQKQHQMVLHMNIHYMERKFKCEPCAVSFRTQGHLQKHERSEAHRNKVMMNSTFGVPTTSNPRPFECADCKVAFRIHGHLAKHLRSKTHVQKLECLQKLPFGTYAEIERAGISLTEIDTTDCDNSLASLRELAQRLIEKDPTKMGTYTKPSCIDGGTNESSSEDSPEAVASEALDASPGVVSSNSGSGSSVTSSALSSSSVDSPAGVKRKFDSFSSCSNDSISNAPNLPAGSTTVNTPAEGTSEKRIRTNSDP